jgi:hypothetical protein
MRNTRWICLLGRKARRVVLAGGLALLGSGCHQHYYYYGNPPACPPGTTVLPSTVSAGPVCEVPSDVSSSRPRSTIISDGRRSRVVVSEPSGSRSRLSAWRSADPDSPPAVTQVEGALEDSSVKK